MLFYFILFYFILFYFISAFKSTDHSSVRVEHGNNRPFNSMLGNTMFLNSFENDDIPHEGFYAALPYDNKF